MYAHPQAQDVGFAHVDAGTSLMVGSVARAGMNRPARRCTKRCTVSHAHAEEVTLGEDGKPSVLVARAYRNSPRDHDEYERRKKLAKSKGRPMKHILKVTEAMKANENFDFDEHPELDWPMYNCEVRLGRHCPECFVWNQRRVFDPCGEGE